MKKLLLLAISLATILSSCSSDSDNFATPDDATLYPVKFTVPSSFAIDGSEMAPKASFNTRAGDQASFTIKYVVYKEDGSVYDYYHQTNQVKNVEDLEYIIDLPIGKYTIVVASSTEQHMPETPTLKVALLYEHKNLYEDIITTDRDYLHNLYQLYATQKQFEVTGESSISEMGLTLKPMWSEIKFAINDRATFEAPNKVTQVSFMLDDEKCAIRAQDLKSVSFKEPKRYFGQWYSYTLDHFRTLADLNVQDWNPHAVSYFFVAQDDKATISINFLTEHNTTITKTIYEGELKAGYKYNLTGSLGKVEEDGQNNIHSIQINKDELVESNLEFN